MKTVNRSPFDSPLYTIKRTVKRNFLYKKRRIKIVEIEINGYGGYHVWVGRKEISTFGFGNLEEAIEAGKIEINNSKYRRK